MIQRKVPLKRSKKPIAARSVRRLGQEREYRRLSYRYKLEHPLCEVCHERKTTDVHHRKGRLGQMLNDVEHFLAVCRPCHENIHSHPGWARDQGYLSG